MGRAKKGEVPGGAKGEAPGGPKDEVPGGAKGEVPGGPKDEAPGGAKGEVPGGAKGEGAKGEAPGGAKGEVPGGAKGEPPGGAPAREVSAGGVVVHDGRVLAIVPTRRAADGSLVLALPKGHLDKGESAEQAAAREVREETGVQARLVRELGAVRYWYVRGGRRVAKSVRFFLFDYVSGDVADHDDEVLEARWLQIERACKELTYPGEREMVARALALTCKDR